jgi:CRP-like cAMP-binding protein
MFTSDPVSVHQLRRADHIEAEQDRRSHRVGHEVPRGKRHSVSPWSRMTKPTELDGSLELFVGLNRRSLKQLARHFVFVELAPGEVLGRQGETASEFVVVLEGQIGVTLDGLPLAVLDQGSQFGALPLIDGGPGRFRRASFDVLEPSRLAVADRLQFVQILKQHPLVGHRIRQIAEQRRAYLQGHADATALHADRERDPFPVHLV